MNVRTLSAGVLTRLKRQPPDALLALIGLYRADPRPDKIDVGVGVYRNPRGDTPVFGAVKQAEQRLFAEQSTKAYLGPEGDVGFFERLAPLIFGHCSPGARLSGLQTPGGTGALRLAAELIAGARPNARILVGTPTWPNHLPIFAAAGVEIASYSYFDINTQTLLFDVMVDALEQAHPGDVVLLHGCCHNPTGADLDNAQWATVAEVIAERGLLPLIDLAYQGLGSGLDADAGGVRLVLGGVDEALIAYSCDKNFGLYRERTGALFALVPDAGTAAVTQSNLLALARANWSMPPDHGAATVRIILEDEGLTAQWALELATMCSRLNGVRHLLAELDPTLTPLRGHRGLFATLPLSPDQVRRLREDHAVYMAGSGRINVAGLTDESAPRFVSALDQVR